MSEEVYSYVYQCQKEIQKALIRVVALEHMKMQNYMSTCVVYCLFWVWRKAVKVYMDFQTIIYTAKLKSILYPLVCSLFLLSKSIFSSRRFFLANKMKDTIR